MEFNELDAGSYTVDVEATLSGALSGVGSAEVAVTEGETASCSVLMNRVYTADAAVEYIESLEAGSYKVIVAGAIDDGGIEGIKTALNENNINKPLVSLDLGRTTGLSSIGAAKFQKCTALSAIVLPEGIGSIKESAFEECTSLASVTIPDTVNEIGQFAFRNCSALKSIEIPNSVTTIAIGAFRDCTALTSIEIPRGVITIGSDSFNGCTALETITIPASLTSIGANAFVSCNKLKTVYYSGTKEQWSSSSIESSLASGVTIICSNGNTTTP